MLSPYGCVHVVETRVDRQNGVAKIHHVLGKAEHVIVRLACPKMIATPACIAPAPQRIGHG